MTVIKLAGKTWKTKAALHHHIKEVVASATPNEPLTGYERDLANELLDRHASRAVKIGEWKIVKDFVIDKNSGSNWKASRCFWVIRRDDTRVSFSWKECLLPSSQRSIVLTAMREAIADDIFDFRKMSNAIGAHFQVHHKNIPFIQIAEFFVKQFGGFNGIELSREDDFSSLKMNYFLELKWIAFHAEYAQLEIVTTEEHKAKHRK